MLNLNYKKQKEETEQKRLVLQNTLKQIELAEKEAIAAKEKSNTIREKARREKIKLARDLVNFEAKRNEIKSASINAAAVIYTFDLVEGKAAMDRANAIHILTFDEIFQKIKPYLFESEEDAQYFYREQFAG